MDQAGEEVVGTLITNPSMTVDILRVPCFTQ